MDDGRFPRARGLCTLWFPLILLLGAAPAWAGKPGPAAKPLTVLEKTPKKKPVTGKKKKKGPVPYLRIGLNFAFAQSEGVVGVPDGVSLALGLSLHTGLVFRRGPHEWLTSLSLQETQTKVPGIAPFIKGTDRVEVTSFYRYRFRRVGWLGVYGGVRAVSSLLEGSLVRSDDVLVALTPTRGPSFTETVPAQKPYPLTPFLSPLRIKESAGAVLDALKRKTASLKFEVGIAALQVLTQKGYVVTDDKATEGIVELTQMRDYVQGGVEVQATFGGKVLDKLLGYSLLARMLLPFATSVESDLSVGDSINVELRAALTIKVFSWAALHYSLSVLRIPLLTPDWQVANNLLLSITTSIGGKDGR